MSDPVISSGIIVPTDVATLTLDSTLWATDTIVRSKGQVYVSDGGLATETVISKGGFIHVYDGGQISGLTVSGSGTLNINSGGSVVDADVTNWKSRVNVSSGGVIVSASMLAGSAVCMLLGGSASDATVINGGALYVTNNGSASGTVVLSSGAVNVSAGCTIYNTVIREANGQEIISNGTANDTVVSAGAQVLRGTAVANRTVLTEAGAIYMSGAAVANSTLVESGGIIYQRGGTVIDATINGGGRLLYSAGSFSGALTLGGDLVLKSAGASLETINMLQTGIIYAVGNLTVANPINVSVTSAMADGVHIIATGATAIEFVLNNGSETLDGLGKAYTIENTTENVQINVGVNPGKFSAITDASSLTEANKFANFENVSAYGGTLDSASTVTDFYAAQNIAAGNTVINIDGFSNAAAQIYGGGSSTSLDGTAMINLVSGTVAAAMGGAVTNTLSVVSATVTAGGAEGTASATVIYGAGRGNVTSNVAVNVSSGATVTGQTYGGGVLLSTATADLVIGGDVTLNLDGGTFGSDIVGGCRVNGGTAGTGIISGTVALNVSGGTLAASKSVYGGGFAASNGATDTEIDVQGGVAINWNGGTMAGEAANGRGIFGGALAANGATAQVASVNIAVVDGSVTNIFGGGWSQSGAVSNVTGDVNITISGGSVANVFGGGAHADGEAGTTSVGGDVTITVSGGSVNKIFAAGQQEGDEITGTANVVFTGSSDFATTVSGAGYQGANADATAYLTFDAYTGSFTGSVANFDAVKVSGETAATLTGAEITNNAWNFDLAANTGAATLLTWSDAETIGTSLELGVSTSNAVATGWDLIAGGAATDFAGVAYKLSIDGEAAIDLELGATVSGTGTAFDGYTLYKDSANNTLKFGTLA